MASGLFYGVAGGLVFLVLLNRDLILRPDSRAKMWVMLAGFVGLAGGGALCGFLLPPLPWLLVPTAVFCSIMLGEWRRARVRRVCRGSQPLDTTPHAVNIRMPFTTTDLAIHRYEVPHAKWHGDRLRIVHVTDLHVHPRIPLTYYQDALAAAAETGADIAVFTGDYISRAVALPKLRDVLRPIGKLGTYAVLGNHDFWAGAEGVSAAIRDAGIQLIKDNPVRLNIEGNRVVVSGTERPWAHGPEVQADGDPDGLHITLSHTPDNIYDLAAGPSDFVFSGHYHAGQIRLPGLGSIVVPSIYGRRFDHGHFVVDDTHLFVASGIGSGNPPVRIYCQPDIFVIDVVGSVKKKTETERT